MFWRPTGRGRLVHALLSTGCLPSKHRIDLPGLGCWVSMRYQLPKARVLSGIRVFRQESSGYFYDSSSPTFRARCDSRRWDDEFDAPFLSGNWLNVFHTCPMTARFLPKEKQRYRRSDGRIWYILCGVHRSQYNLYSSLILQRNGGRLRCRLLRSVFP